MKVSLAGMTAIVAPSRWTHAALTHRVTTVSGDSLRTDVKARTGFSFISTLLYFIAFLVCVDGKKANGHPHIQSVWPPSADSVVYNLREYGVGCTEN